MTLPSLLQIGPHSFAVKVGKKVDRRLDTDNTNGHTIVDHAEIRLRTNVPHSVQAVTLLHEALHAIWSTTPLRTGESEVEEQTITALAAPLLDVLLRNPDLVDFLLEK